MYSYDAIFQIKKTDVLSDYFGTHIHLIKCFSMAFFPPAIQKTEVEIKINILKMIYFFFLEETNQQNSSISLQLRIL